MELSKKEQKALRIIFTDYLADYNAYTLKDKLGISDVGSLKLLRRLKEKNLLTSRKMGNATFYKVNVENDYATKLLELLFLDHSEQPSFVKGWIQDLKSFDEVKAVFLFGSVLRKGRDANDIDVCFILHQHGDYKEIQKKVEEVNHRNRQKLHPLYLTEEDFKQKLLGRDRPIVEMVRSCIVVHGQEVFVRALKEVRQR